MSQKIGACGANRTRLRRNTTPLFENYTHFTRNTRIEKPCLVIFYASWCAFCKQLEPIIASVRKEIPILVVNGNDREMMEKYGVKGYPTLYWMKPGQKERRYYGYRKRKALLKAFQQFSQ